MEIPALAVGKNGLHAGLRVVKVAPHGAHLHVAAGLGGHLCLLHGGHAAVGIEYDDPRPRHVVEALHSRLAGVAGGGGQDHHVTLHALGLSRRADEMGQHRQRHVLERGGGPVIQLQHILVRHRRQGRQIRGGELFLVAGPHQRGHIVKVRQQRVEDVRRHVQCGLFQSGPPVEAQPGRVADIQTAVRGDALQHRVGGGGGELLVSRAVIVHEEHLRKIYSCICDGPMIHCLQQKSKCFSLVDKKNFFVAAKKSPHGKYQRKRRMIC